MRTVSIYENFEIQKIMFSKSPRTACPKFHGFHKCLEYDLKNLKNFKNLKNLKNFKKIKKFKKFKKIKKFKKFKSDWPPGPPVPEDKSLRFKGPLRKTILK